MPVQTAYAETMKPGKAGMVANMTNWDGDTRLCETVAGIGFGKAVGQGSDAKGVRIGAAAATGFVGIAIRDVTLEISAGDKYLQGQNVAVLTEGDIWVVANAQVTAGQDVTFHKDNGTFSTVAADSNNFAIAGARWMTSAGAGELAVLRLSGHLPAA